MPHIVRSPRRAAPGRSRACRSLRAASTGTLIPALAIGLPAIGLLAFGAAACARPRTQAAGSPALVRSGGDPRPALIPWPASATLSATASFPIVKETVIEVPRGQPDAQRMARALADLLRPALDATLAIRESDAPAASGAIRLEIGPAATPATPPTAAPSTAAPSTATPAAGSGAGERVDESYELTIAATGIRIVAPTPAGLFYGTQTLRQLLPASVEWRGARPHAVTVPTGRIADRPRFAWRGAMLDVARHFFAPADVKRYIDLLALYKFNRLHLHLSDDQGWRIEIASWPNLTTHGGSTAVGGGPGGFYTTQAYADLVAYARDRFITIVPEIDVPSHINAALASYPELNCDGVAPPLYTGIDVGFSALCVDKEVTYRFLDDVVREIAAMTPGPYFHIGGDEVKKLTPAQYRQFIDRMQGIVQKHGKTTIGWDEIVHSTLLPTTIVQYWRPDASIGPPAGTKLVLSPAHKIYLDMKYDPATPIGLNWAANVDVAVPYAWDPAMLLKGVSETAILGIEAPIWSETVATFADVEFMAFPRLAAVAEVAWSPQEARRWTEFRVRLGAQAPRWSALGINAYWSSKVDWRR